MSTVLFRSEDALDPDYVLTIERGAGGTGIKLFVYSEAARTGAKFWFRDRRHMKDLREALDWISDDVFGPESEAL